MKHYRIYRELKGSGEERFYVDQKFGEGWVKLTYNGYHTIEDAQAVVERDKALCEANEIVERVTVFTTVPPEVPKPWWTKVNSGFNGAMIFLVLSIISGFKGFDGTTGPATRICQILFLLFLSGFLISLVMVLVGPPKRYDH